MGALSRGGGGAVDAALGRCHARRAHFELAQHLHRRGDAGAAVGHFRQAHRLQPENWTYKRQAWSLTGPDGPVKRFWQGPMEGQDWPYDSEYAAEILATPRGRYYPPVAP